jgi:hypothetical protein
VEEERFQVGSTCSTQGGEEMKRTGRRLTLSNDINSITPPGSITGSSLTLATIFEDDRENFGWKIIDVKQLAPITLTARPSNWALMSVRPDSFKDITVFGQWATNHQPWDNSLIATFNTGIGEPYSLRTEHIATNHLSMFFNQGEIPYYNITLEEYQISSEEEIMLKIKETSQSLNDIGE